MMLFDVSDQFSFYEIMTHFSLWGNEHPGLLCETLLHTLASSSPTCFVYQADGDVVNPFSAHCCHTSCTKCKWLRRSRCGSVLCLCTPHSTREAHFCSSHAYISMMRWYLVLSLMHLRCHFLLFLFYLVLVNIATVQLRIP